MCSFLYKLVRKQFALPCWCCVSTQSYSLVYIKAIETSVKKAFEKTCTFFENLSTKSSEEKLLNELMKKYVQLV